MLQKSIYIISFAILLSLCACNNPVKTGKNDSSPALSDTDSSDLLLHPEFEKWEVFAIGNNDDPDLIIDSVCHAVDSLGEFEPIDRIYTSDQVSGLYYCESMFFRKHKKGGSIATGFLYANFSENDSVMLVINWFELGGSEKINSIFSYQHNDDKNFFRDKWVIIISQDENNVYYSDIFFEDCGMHECGMTKLFSRSPVYDQYFGSVASVEDFTTKFPFYYNIQKFKKFFENIGMMKIVSMEAHFNVWEKQKLLNE